MINEYCYTVILLIIVFQRTVNYLLSTIFEFQKTTTTHFSKQQLVETNSNSPSKTNIFRSLNASTQWQIVAPFVRSHQNSIYPHRMGVCAHVQWTYLCILYSVSLSLYRICKLQENVYRIQETSYTQLRSSLQCCNPTHTQFTSIFVHYVETTMHNNLIEWNLRYFSILNIRQHLQAI